MKLLRNLRKRMNKQFQCVLYIFIFIVISIHQLFFARNIAENYLFIEITH